MPVSTISAVIEEARKRWKRCADAEKDQRTAILAAKKFRAGDQWPEAIKMARAGAASLTGQPPQPPRPCLVVDRLSQPVRQASNTIKNADFGFDVLPNGGGADIGTAEIQKGYLRRVLNDARAESPIEWAADGAIEGGLGWFRIRTKYVHETWDGSEDDPEAYDQELCLERLPNNLAVYCDPSANKPTRCDANFMFVVDDMDKDAFKDRFPDADVRGIEDFQSDGDMQAWVGKDVIRVAEYWRIEWATETITSKDGKFSRVVRTPTVKGSLINAIEELETFPWVGSRIPLIPILGEELNVDGKCKLRGMIEPGMDAQRMVNYTFSGGIEVVALSSKNAPRVAMESIAQYKTIWDTRNLYNYSYLPWDPWDADGRQLPPPADDTTEPPIQALTAMMQIAEESIKLSTNTGDASLGNTNPNERSGTALEALQAQSDLGNSNWAANTRNALLYASQLMLEVLPKITRPGQILHILGMDDEPDAVMVGQPFSVDANGQPQAAPSHVTPEMAMVEGSEWKFYDLTNGRYASTVTIGKATATRRQEGSTALGNLIPHLPPEMAAVATPEYVEQLSFPGAQAIAEKLRKALPPNLQQQEDGQQPTPEQLAAQLQQAQAQIQQLQGLANDNQVKLQIAQGSQQSEIQREQMRNATAIAVARINAAKAAFDTVAEAAEERLSTGIQVAHEVREAEKDRAHDVALAAMDHGAAARAQGADHGHELASQMVDQAHAADQAEKQAQNAAALVSAQPDDTAQPGAGA